MMVRGHSPATGAKVTPRQKKHGRRLLLWFTLIFAFPGMLVHQWACLLSTTAGNVGKTNECGLFLPLHPQLLLLGMSKASMAVDISMNLDLVYGKRQLRA